MSFHTGSVKTWGADMAPRGLCAARANAH